MKYYFLSILFIFLVCFLTSCNSKEVCMINEIKTIKFIYCDKDNHKDFIKGEIPQDKWNKFLSLFPLSSQENNPAKWQYFAVVDIELILGKQIKMVVYKTNYNKNPNGKGAFSIGEKYYRSASDIEFRNFFNELNTNTEKQK